MILVNILETGGIIIGAVGGLSAFISVLPTKQIAAYFSESSLSTIRTKYLLRATDGIPVGETVNWVCDGNLEFLFFVLRDQSIPYEEKKKVLHRALFKHLKLNTNAKRIYFILCMIKLLLALYNLMPSSYYLLLQQLIEAVRSGKIGKKVFYAIIRKLRKRVVLDPDIIEVI